MNIDPVAFSIFGVSIHWYGLMWLAASYQLYFVIKKLGGQIIAKKDMSSFAENAVFAIFIGSFIGGRIGYVLFYGIDQFLDDPVWLFKVWQGGMSFHGGLIGATFAMIWISKSQKISLLRVGDAIALGTPLGLAFGRLGNFVNGELWGRPTDLPWGMVFVNADVQARHPSQLYELAAEGFIIFALLLFLSKKHYKVGLITASFLLSYGILRFLIEFVREPDAHIGLLALNLTTGQWLSIPLILAGIIGLVTVFKKDQTKEKHQHD